MIGKGIDGVLEIIGGILLIFISPDQIHHMVKILTQHELSEDPHDLIASFLLSSTQHLSQGLTTFASLYLLVHGVVKVVLVVGLLRKWRWSYPVAMLAFSLFVVYQLYRYSHTHAFSLILLSILDVITIVLTLLEYQRLVGNDGFARQEKLKG